MPDAIFGVDIDDIFKLATPKYVYVRDWKLGALKYTLMVAILFYVIGYDILYSCSHLVPQVATGYGSVSLHHPVQGCDDGECDPAYKNIATLRYCTESAQFTRRLSPDEDSDEDDAPLVVEDDPAEIGKFITTPNECRYLDHDRLTMQEVPNELFIPMRYVSYDQTMGADCYDPVVRGLHGHSTRKHSEKHYRCKQSWQTVNRSEFFVADIENFTLKMKHSFMAPAIGMAGVSTTLAGFIRACQDSHPKSLEDCIRMKFPGGTYSSETVVSEDMQGLQSAEKLGIRSLSSKRGVDIMSVGDLFRLTPEAIKHGWQDDVADRKMPATMGHPEYSLREAGGMLMLSVNYDNTGVGRPGFPYIDLPGLFLGAIKPITYTYRPYFIPTTTNKKVEVFFKSEQSTHRTVNVWFGVTVKLSFEGQLVKFSMTQLLTTLTTALVLLSSATTIVTYLALYVMKASDKYTLMMYQYTEDFSEYKDLMKMNREKKAANKPVCPVSSPSGLVLAKAYSGKDEKLTNDELLEILTDYEIRLNRLDGVDPELAFPANPTGSEINAAEKDAGLKMCMELYKANASFKQKFLKCAANWTDDDVSRSTKELLGESEKIPLLGPA